MLKHLTIGRLAASTGVKIETIRYYERIGLVGPAMRTGGNYRSYRDEDVERLNFIRRMRALGFSLDDIRKLLDLSTHDDDCGSINAMASEHLAEVDRKIADLKALRRELAAAVKACEGGAVADCRILEAFASK